MNEFETTLRKVRDSVTHGSDLLTVMDQTKDARTFPSELAGTERDIYVLPYSSRPAYIGERWK